MQLCYTLYYLYAISNVSVIALMIDDVYTYTSSLTLIVALPLGTLPYCNPWPMKCQRTETHRDAEQNRYRES